MATQSGILSGGVQLARRSKAPNLGRKGAELRGVAINLLI